MKRSSLVETLTVVSGALATTNLVPVFQCFCFREGRVHAYNEQIAIVAPCEVEGAFAVHGKTLLGLLEASNADEVHFKLMDNELQVICDKSEFKLPIFPEDNFIFKTPRFTEDDYIMTITPEVLKALETCLTTVSRDQTQAAFLGVFLSTHAAYSCDGDALTRYTHYPRHKEEEDAKNRWGDRGVMLPTTFCETVLKLEHDVSGGNISKEWIEVDARNGRAYGRLINNTFDFEGLINKTVKGTATFVPTTPALDAALKRARVVADPFGAKTTLEVRKNKLVLLTDTSLGVITDVVPFKHPDVVANVSAEKVQRALSICGEMAIMDNCTVYRNGETVLQVLANMR